MAHQEPFAAIRYDPARVVPDDVVSPPYDVVGPAERARLADTSPYNAIHVELPVSDPIGGLDQYQNASRIFRGWLDAGIVRRDPRAGFYLYRMSFEGERGQPRVMTGLLGTLGLDLHGAGDVLAHEQTIPKDRLDRLSILRSTRLNTSPIWVLSLGPGLAAACREALSQATGQGWRATDAAGVVHELWPVTDERRVAEITALVAGGPVLIADGHHRYETACTYAGERRAANGDKPGPYDLALAFVVELSEEELSIGAIHRLVTGIAASQIEDLLARFFRIAPAGGDLPALPPTSAPGEIGLLTHDGFKLLTPLPTLYQAAEDDLDVSRLKVALGSLPAHELSYQAGWDLAVAAVRTGRADAAFLLGPVPVARIRRVAHDGRRMPPKSTYFQPKPLTGMAYRSLED